MLGSCGWRNRFDFSLIRWNTSDAAAVWDIATVASASRYSEFASSLACARQCFPICFTFLQHDDNRLMERWQNAIAFIWRYHLEKSPWKAFADKTWRWRESICLFLTFKLTIRIHLNRSWLHIVEEGTQAACRHPAARLLWAVLLNKFLPKPVGGKRKMMRSSMKSLRIRFYEKLPSTSETTAESSSIHANVFNRCHCLASDILFFGFLLECAFFFFFSKWTGNVLLIWSWATFQKVEQSNPGLGKLFDLWTSSPKISQTKIYYGISGKYETMKMNKSITTKAFEAPLCLALYWNYSWNMKQMMK